MVLGIVVLDAFIFCWLARTHSTQDKIAFGTYVNSGRGGPGRCSLLRHPLFLLYLAPPSRDKLFIDQGL